MPDHANGTANCILLFGMPRSGTTWLGKLFDSHPHVLYRHEPDTWSEMHMGPDPASAETQRHVQQLQRFVRALPQINAVRVAGKRPIFPKAFMSYARYRLIQASTEIARVASRVNPQFPILFHASGDSDPERRVVWKSIQSLAQLGPMLDALEQARGIHILRHPCGYVASVRRGLNTGKFSHGGADSNAYGVVGRIVGTPLGDDLGFDASFESYMRSLTPEERIAWMWVVVNEKAARDCADNERYLCVRYEDICAEPLAGVEDMFAFAGLSMNTQTRDFIAASTGVTRDDYYSVFKNPQAAAWRWMNELEPAIIDRVSAIAARTDIGARYLATPQTGRVPA